MRKLCIALLLFFIAIPALAQYRGRLSSDDQRRFDSYYQRWQEYKRTNNRDEIASMEKRMQDVMEHYNIPRSTPYEAIASNSYSDPYRRYRGKFSPDDQRRYDSYYQRWQEYKRTNNRDEISSMERRMQDVMRQYNIPTSVPYGVLASNGNTGQWDDGWSRWHGRLSAEDQGRFDSYYTRWLDYKRTNNQDEVRSMEGRMRDLMQQYDIPASVPFDRIASSGSNQPGQGFYGELRILNATYGNGFRVANVTARLQDLVRNGQLSVYVDNDSMGRDPAPDARKSLTVSYSYRGRTQTVTAKEGTGLTIP